MTAQLSPPPVSPLPQVKELEEQLGRRPEPEELDMARAALAMAEDEKLQLMKRLQEAEGRLVGLEEEGGCFHPCLTQAGARSGARGMPTALPARGWGGFRLRGTPVPPHPCTTPTAPYCSGVVAGEGGPGSAAAEPDPRIGCTRATATAATATATTRTRCPCGVSDTAGHPGHLLQKAARAAQGGSSLSLL